MWATYYGTLVGSLKYSVKMEREPDGNGKQKPFMPHSFPHCIAVRPLASDKTSPSHFLHLEKKITLNIRKQKVVGVLFYVG